MVLSGDLTHFASRTFTSCNDDEKDVFTLGALYQEIDNQAIGEQS